MLTARIVGGSTKVVGRGVQDESLSLNESETAGEVHPWRTDQPDIADVNNSQSMWSPHRMEGYYIGTF